MLISDTARLDAYSDPDLFSESLLFSLHQAFGNQYYPLAKDTLVNNTVSGQFINVE